METLFQLKKLWFKNLSKIDFFFFQTFSTNVPLNLWKQDGKDLSLTSSEIQDICNVSVHNSSQIFTWHFK